MVPPSSINLQIELIETLFVPEPSTLVLAGCGAIGLLLAARRRRSRRDNDEPSASGQAPDIQSKLFKFGV